MGALVGGRGVTTPSLSHLLSTARTSLMLQGKGAGASSSSLLLLSLRSLSLSFRSPVTAAVGYRRDGPEKRDSR